MLQTHVRHLLRGAAIVALMLLPVPATSITNAPSATPDLPPATAAMDLDAGAAAVENHKYALAVKRLTRAIDSQSLNSEALALAYHHRGIAQQKLGFDGLAIRDYSKAMDLGTLPRDVLARAYYNRGLAKSKSGDTVGAELDYSHAIENAPRYAAAYHNRANLERERKDFPTAIRDYSVAIDNLSGQPRTLPLMGRALSYKNSGDIASAAADLDRVLAIDPTYKPAAEMRRELATLPASSYMASAANDRLETGSISQSSVAPRHGEVIQQTAQNGWNTKTTRYDAPPPPKVLAANEQQGNDDLITGSLRPIDMVPAPVETNVKTASIEPTSPTPPPVVPVAAASKLSGTYKMQLGAFRAPELAAQAWNQISQKSAALVTSLNFTIEQADLGAKGTYFRLQAGDFKTAADARTRCADFAAHQIDCIVVAR
jgi:tetratricopeptide (TPR) repeat protein